MRVLPTADRVLTAFAADHRATLPAAARPAFDRFVCDLRLAVELEGEGLLDVDDAVLLHAERQFDRLGAVGRLLGPADTARVLERYVADPVYRPGDATESQLRIDACVALLRRLAILPELSGRARLLRRVEETIRIEAGALGPLRRRRGRRVRS